MDSGSEAPSHGVRKRTAKWLRKRPATGVRRRPDLLTGKNSTGTIVTVNQRQGFLFQKTRDEKSAARKPPPISLALFFE